MNKVTIEEAFKRENLDINAITVQGVPERHVEAVIAYAKLITGADHVDGDGALDFTDRSQYKYSAYAVMGSPSGAGFSFDGHAYWISLSRVGSRLSFKKSEAATWFFKRNIELFKKVMVYNRDLKFLNNEK
jgi:hypothetical protein